MTHDEFETQMKRLALTYGEKSFPVERFQMFWKKFKYTNADHFEMAIDTFIADSYQPPTLTKMFDHLMVAKKQKPMPDEFDPMRKKLAESEQAGRCRRCFGSGVIGAHHRGQLYLTCFICSCSAGDLASDLPENRHKLPRWTIERERSFAPIGESEPERDAVIKRMTVNQLLRETTRGIDG